MASPGYTKLAVSRGSRPPGRSATKHATNNTNAIDSLLDMSFKAQNVQTKANIAFMEYLAHERDMDLFRVTNETDPQHDMQEMLEDKARASIIALRQSKQKSVRKAAATERGSTNCASTPKSEEGSSSSRNLSFVEDASDSDLQPVPPRRPTTTQQSTCEESKMHSNMNISESPGKIQKSLSFRKGIMIFFIYMIFIKLACRICDDPDSTLELRRCVECSNSVHHMCQNEMMYAKGASDVPQDVNVCSIECWNIWQVKHSMNLSLTETPTLRNVFHSNIELVKRTSMGKRKASAAALASFNEEGTYGHMYEFVGVCFFKTNA